MSFKVLEGWCIKAAEDHHKKAAGALLGFPPTPQNKTVVTSDCNSTRASLLDASFPKKSSSRTLAFWEQVLLFAAYTLGTFDLLQGQGCPEQKPISAATMQLSSPVRLLVTAKEWVGNRIKSAATLHTTSSSSQGGGNPASSFIPF